MPACRGRPAATRRINHAGNVAAAVLAMVIGDHIAYEGIFYLLAGMCIATIVATRFIRPGEIDHDLARGAAGAGSPRRSARAASASRASPMRRPIGIAPARRRMGRVFRDRRILIFSASVVLFHFANAAMLPLAGQKLSHGHDRGAAGYMSACIIAAQLVMVPVALLSSRLAVSWGRRPVFLAGFAILPVRGVLYTMTSSPYALVGIQLLDGIGAGIFGVVGTLVIADLTRGTGRFNLMQGALATATGIGAAASNLSHAWSQPLDGQVRHGGTTQGGVSVAAGFAYSDPWVFPGGPGWPEQRYTGHSQRGWPATPREGATRESVATLGPGPGGANTWLRAGRVPEEAEDGILTAEDVSGLNLVSTELVVLSACETGLGEVQLGEGVFGLRRAFVLAGAKTLVMSLWKVPDEPTRELMEDFYSRLLAGEGRAEALRQAQLAMKAKYPDPFYWGAFICQGDPGPLVLPPVRPRRQTVGASVDRAEWFAIRFILFLFALAVVLMAATWIGIICARKFIGSRSPREPFVQ